MKSCCKKLKIPVSTQEQVISLLNSIHIQPIARGNFFGSPPNLLQQQITLYYFCTQDSILKCFLTFKPQFRDDGWPNLFPTAWQVWNAPCAETNKQRCCLHSIHPSTLPPGRSITPLYGQRNKPDCLHTDITHCCLTARNISVSWENHYQWEKKKYWAQRSHPIALESSEIFAAATKNLMWNTSCLVIMNVILTREFIIHLLKAYRICHGIVTIFTTLLIITYTDRKFSSFFTFKMCFTTKISTPRSGVLISLEKNEVNPAPDQNWKEEEKAEQENSPLWHATTWCE